MTCAQEQARAVFLSVLLIVSMVGGIVALGGAATGSEHNSVTQSDISDLQHSSVIYPQEQSFVAGTTFPLIVSTEVGDNSFLSEESIANPEVEVSVSDNIEITQTLAEDYTSTDQKSPTSVTISSTEPFEPKTIHTSVVLISIPSDAGTDFSVTATPKDGNKVGESTTETYEINSRQSSSEAFAEAAEARLRIAESYQSRYSVLLDNEPWEERYQGAIKEGFSTAIISGTKGAAIGSTGCVESP